AKSFLMEKGWEPELGARPLRRCIEHYVQDELAECMLRGMNPDGKHIVVDYKEGEDKLTLTISEIPASVSADTVDEKHEEMAECCL
ncbi:MAG: hypothetical protein K2I83_05125, partial [Bacteroidales bacterium]|nr:hypothetical protein [Bacteroidales bacterium]